MLSELKILVVDDDAISSFLVERILSQHGCNVIWKAKHGVEAWDRLESGEIPDILISDISMPKMDGVELLRRMRLNQKYARIPVILCTALNDRNTVLDAASVKPDFYILKPYTSAKLLNCIQWVSRKAANHTYEEFDAANKRWGIDRDTYGELVLAFTGALSETVKSLDDCGKSNDWEPALTQISSFKSACLSIAKDELAMLVAELETAVKEQKLNEIAHARERLELELTLIQPFPKS